jgi:hypothetical protein
VQVPAKELFFLVEDNLPQKKEALNLVDEGLLRGHNKEEIANEGDWHSHYIKKGSNPQELPPTLNRQVYST